MQTRKGMPFEWALTTMNLANAYHDIRHTVAKYLNDLQKVGLKKVQQVLRHRKQTTTEIYVEGSYTDTHDVMKLLEEKNLKKFS